jgi:1-aminocyclopropane-1-carboxylate deaminase
MKELIKWEHLFCQNATSIIRLEDFYGVKISVKRDNLNHHVVQGNKLRKLKYNIKYAIENNYQSIATFGGAWSNHIVATAKAAAFCQINSIGFIRGDELENQPNRWSPSLVKAADCGMQLVFLSRQEYRQKLKGDTVKSFIENHPHSIYYIPEGGSNARSLQGVSEIIDELAEQTREPGYIITACGTGGTMAGLIDGVAQHKWKTKVIGVSVLKGANYLLDEVKKISLHHSKEDWEISHKYHAGGYAKIDNKTEQFAKQFSKKTGIYLDKIYTAKAFYGAYDLIRSGEISPNSRVVIIHTGGLQGGIIE